MADKPKRRYRLPEPKPGVLQVAYGREDRYSNPSLVYVYGGDGSCKADANLLSIMLEARDHETGHPLFGHPDKSRSLIGELERRGYDITTLKFSIRKKAP